MTKERAQEVWKICKESGEYSDRSLVVCLIQRGVINDN